jgi:hypothetical protein
MTSRRDFLTGSAIALAFMRPAQTLLATPGKPP